MYEGKDKWEHLKDNERIAEQHKNQYQPPSISENTALYLNAVFSVSKCWKRTGFGELMYLDMKDVKEESKYHEVFTYLSLKNVKWALEIYEEITINVKQNNNNTPSKS